jgi:hypothetical protein
MIARHSRGGLLDACSTDPQLPSQKGISRLSIARITARCRAIFQSQ